MLPRITHETLRIVHTPQIGTVFTTLNSSVITESNKAPQLKQLLLRLDYNEFISKKKWGKLFVTQNNAAAAGRGVSASQVVL